MKEILIEEKKNRNEYRNRGTNEASVLLVLLD